MMKILIFILGLFLCTSVNAMTLTNSTNTFDSSTINNLLNIADSRLENFTDYNFIAFQNDEGYSLLVFDEHTITNSSITIPHCTRILYYRESNYSTYNYSITELENVTFNAQYVFTSNLNMPFSSNSSQFQQRKYETNTIRLLMLILSFVFASLLLKRRYSV